MKARRQASMVRLAIHMLAACGLLALAGGARATAILSFTGGSNNPLAVTVGLPVSYTVNALPSGSEPFFVFKNVGNSLSSQQGLTGSITYSVNGGAANSITAGNSSVAVGSIAPTDLFFFGTSASRVNGDIVTLSKGTVTTTGNVANAAPAGGSFTTFITDSNGAQVSTVGVTVPEPAMLGLVALGGTAMLRSRRRRPQRSLNG
jgi:hypothetical protein